MPVPLAAMFGIESPAILAGGLVMVAIVAAVAWRRRVAMGWMAMLAIGLGLVALALAAGGVLLRLDDPRPVTVMVDLSASTRTARYRDPDHLRRRIEQLLGSTPHRIVCFAADNRTGLPEGAPLSDLPGETTVFAPPPASAILLFSDGRFAPPASAAPVYPAIDSMLQDPPDAAVRMLELRGREVAASLSNASNEQRLFSLTGESQRAIDSGSFTIARPAPAESATILAELRGEDPWPENDRLSIRIPPPASSERWWVGGSAPAGWRAIVPGSLPLEPAAYLAPSIIVLDNISAGDLADAQQERLAQYARDLGGSVVILGGDRAFASGGYPGTMLDQLSPLASDPPEPTIHWIILADSSGSMASGPPGATRWEQVSRALLSLLPKLPPDDPVTLGSFAENLAWWVKGRPAREAAALPLPPPRVRPTGPTNLEASLFDLLANIDAGLPVELLILSDADADFARPDALAARLAEKKVRLHLLDTWGQGRGLPALRRLAAQSRGNVVQELDPARWVAATQRLLEMSRPPRMLEKPADAAYRAPLVLPSRRIESGNRTWAKKDVQLLADTRIEGQLVPLAARWARGAGSVAAVAFRPAASELAAIERLMPHPPADPRYSVTWQSAPMLRVRVDAVDGGKYLNGLAPELELTDELLGDARRTAIPQVAPGRYELELPPPRWPALAAVRLEGRALDRAAIAGRYAPEFSAIGNDVAALRALAERTGGAIVPPTQSQAIRFPWPRREVALRSILCAAGFALVGLGMLAWRVRPVT